jgi:hypothetical protein
MDCRKARDPEGRLYMKKLIKGAFNPPWNHPGRRPGTSVLRAGEAISKARRAMIPLQKELHASIAQNLGLVNPVSLYLMG